MANRLLDPEFYVRIGQLQNIRQLSNLQIIKLHKEFSFKIKRNKKDRRLREDTRAGRIADLDSACDALISEIFRREQLRSFRHFRTSI